MLPQLPYLTEVIPLVVPLQFCPLVNAWFSIINTELQFLNRKLSMCPRELTEQQMECLCVAHGRYSLLPKTSPVGCAIQQTSPGQWLSVPVDPKVYETSERQERFPLGTETPPLRDAFPGMGQWGSGQDVALLPALGSASPPTPLLSAGVVPFGLLGKIHSALSSLPLTSENSLDLNLQVRPRWCFRLRVWPHLTPVFSPSSSTHSSPHLLQNSPFPAVFIDWLLRSECRGGLGDRGTWR